MTAKPTMTVASALELAQDALSQTLTHADMPDTLRNQVGEAYEAVTEAIRAESCTHAGTRRAPVESTDARDELVNLFFQKCSADGKTLAFSKSDLRAFIDKFMETVNELRPLSAAPQSGAELKWCEYCKADTHNDAECWSTQPANWKPGLVDSLGAALSSAAPSQPAGEGLVERLRSYKQWIGAEHGLIPVSSEHGHPLMLEAAAEIERLAEDNRLVHICCDQLEETIEEHKEKERLRAAGAAGYRADREGGVVEALTKAMFLLRRYRDETPLGHQPHMIASEVDDFLKTSALRSEQGKDRK